MARDLKGRFEKGYCGNPNGRPRKRKRTLSDIEYEKEFVEATEEELSVNVGGKILKTTAIDLIHKQLVRKAVAGDTRCMLKVIELRESYSSKDRDEREGYQKLLMEGEFNLQNNPEDVTDRELELLADLHTYLKRN